MIIRAKPLYEEIYICHFDASETGEYKDVDGIMLSELPDPKSFDPDKKKLLILEDLEYSQMNKEDKRRLDRLFGYTSTHKFMSVILTAQDSFRVPPICRCSTVFVLWNSPDKDSMATIARKTGLKSKDLIEIFNKFMPNRYDSLMIDLSHPDPTYRLRKNGYQIIKRKE